MPEVPEDWPATAVARRWLSGALAGAVEAVVTMPFELTKTTQQLGTTRVTSKSTPYASTSSSRLGVWGTMRYVVRHHGLAGLYYGLNITLVQTAGKVGIRFTAFEMYRDFLSSIGIPASTFSAGCLAGGTEAAIWITPCERLKVLRQAQIGVRDPIHTDWVSSIRTILRQQGLRGLYRGLWATVLRNGLSIGVRMALYSHIREILRNVHGKQRASFDPLIAGASVGAITTILNNPLDVIKSRIQADAQGGRSKTLRYTSTWGCVKMMVRGEGVSSLLIRGLPARLMKISLGQAVIFSTYEYAQDLTRKLF
ncbi:hypothetical protein AAMO2058_001408200 [Amorphochlora amoebiformis]